MKRKIISTLLIMVLVVSFTTTVIADTLNEQLNDAKDKVSDAKNQSKKITAEKDATLNEISDLEDSIAEYERELAELKNSIKKVEQEIETKTEEIEKLEKDYAEKKQLLEDRLVTIYEEGQITFLDVLLSAENLWDYISMSSRVSQLAEADNKQMDEVEENRKSVEKAKRELEEKETKLNNDKKSAEAKQKQLKVAKASKETKVASLTSQQKELQAKIKEYNDEVSRIEEEIKKAAQSSKHQYQGNFNGVLSWPLSSSDTRYYNNITSYFGNREQPVPGASTNHRALDIGVPVGTPVYSAADGYVVTTGRSSVRGIYVMVKHADNLYTFYQHLNKVIVSQGQSVKRGQQIARSGNTGIGSGPHLHFEVRTASYYGSEVNPLNYTHW